MHIYKVISCMGLVYGGDGSERSSKQTTKDSKLLLNHDTTPPA